MGVGSFLFEIFVKLGLSSAALDKGLAQTKLKVQQTAREVRKETGQARDATALLGRMFGVTLPAQVTKFIASVGPVRSVLASAFAASVIVGFGAAIIAVIPKIKEMASELGGMGEAMKKLADENIRANQALLLQTKLGTLELLRGVNAELEELEKSRKLAPSDFLFSPAKAARGIFGFPDTEEETRLRDKQRRFAENLNELDRLAAKTGAAGAAEAAAAVGVLTTTLEKARLAWVRYADAVISAELSQAFGGVRRQPVTTLEDLTFGVGSRVFEAGLRAETLRNLMPTGEALERMFPLLVPLRPEIGQITQSASRMKETFESAFQAIGQDLENAIVHFKGFGNVLVSVLQEIQRALVRTFIISPFVGFLTKGLSAVLGGAFGGGAIKVGGLSFPPVPTPPIPRQFGGSALAGRALLVGERGPEIFTPGVSGQITPNRALGGGTVINVDARGADANVEFRVARAVRAAEERGAIRAVRLQRELAMRRA